MQTAIFPYTVSVAASLRLLLLSPLLFLLISCGSAPKGVALTHAAVPPPDPGLDRLARELERVSAVGGGVVGASITHIESGLHVSLRGNERFPLASVYKIAIALTLLNQVDQHMLTLEDPIKLHGNDLRPGSGILAKGARKKGGSWTIQDMLELMMDHSDNTATDFLLARVGGPPAVMSYLRQTHIEGISIDRSTLQMIADSIGIDELPPEDKFTISLFYKKVKGITAERQRVALQTFEADGKDTGTPDSLAALLVRLYKKEFLQPATAQLLLDIMSRNETGRLRIRGILPEGTPVAHKTGTIARSINDIGIVTLPEKAGHLAIAVLVKSSDRETEDKARAIAEIARAAHDFFLFESERSPATITALPLASVP